MNAKITISPAKLTLAIVMSTDVHGHRIRPAIAASSAISAMTNGSATKGKIVPRKIHTKGRHGFAGSHLSGRFTNSTCGKVRKGRQ